MAAFLALTGSVKAQQDLTTRQQAIVPIASFTAAGDMNKLDKALRDGLDAGLTIAEIKEVLTHLYAYVGFPRSLNAINEFMSVLQERKDKGINDKEGRESDPLPTDKSSLELGTEIQTRLSGTAVAGGAMAFAPAIDYYLKAHLFGDIFGRNTIRESDREIATLSALSAMKGTDSQINSHLRYAHNAGLSETQIWNIADVLKQRVGRKEAKRASHVFRLAYGARK